MSNHKSALGNFKNNNQEGGAQIINDVSDNTQLSLEIAKVKKFGLWVLGLGLGGFILFASLVPLDEGVPTQGLVSVETKRKVIQHLQGGIIKDVLVREGQEVAQNQTLIILSDSAAIPQLKNHRGKTSC
jgi:protease secretion system membrane fusion protein